MIKMLIVTTLNIFMRMTSSTILSLSAIIITMIIMWFKQVWSWLPWWRWWWFELLTPFLSLSLALSKSEPVLGDQTLNLEQRGDFFDCFSHLDLIPYPLSIHLFHHVFVFVIMSLSSCLCLCFYKTAFQLSKPQFKAPFIDQRTRDKCRAWHQKAFTLNKWEHQLSHFFQQ